MADRKYFTVAEANALLPEVSRLLAELRRTLASLEELRRRNAGNRPPVQPVPDTPVPPEQFRAISLFHLSLGRINELGVQVKDIGKGLVDFPARSGADEVLLCWQDGEDSVRFFHDLEGGFDARRPIEELPGALLPPAEEHDGGDEE